jgi:hypothetical protein
MKIAAMVHHDRVRERTSPPVNDQIDAVTQCRVEALLERGDRDAIVRRLVELEYEWDVDRALMANFALVGGTTFLLGQTRAKGWTYFFGAQMGFLLLHALAGWCPPAVVFRRLGFRTQKEISAERTLLERSLAEAA